MLRTINNMYILPATENVPLSLRTQKVNGIFTSTSCNKDLSKDNYFDMETYI